MKAQCFVFPWISVVYSFLPFPASQCSGETCGAVVSWGCAASAPQRGAMGSGPGAGKGDLQLLPCWGLTLKEQEGAFRVTQLAPVQGTPRPSSGNSFWVLLYIMRTGPAANWKNENPRVAIRGADPAVPLPDQLWESVQNCGPDICRRYFALVITIISLIYPALSKFLVYIKHSESEAEIPMLYFHHRK